MTQDRNDPNVDDRVVATPGSSTQQTTTTRTPGEQMEPVRIQRTETRQTSNPGTYRPTWSTDAEASALLAARDSVRWGPIVAGLVTALTTFLLLSLLAVGIGLTAADPAGGSTDTQTLGIGSAITGAVIGLVSFFLGGLVAARTAATVGRPAGALNGFLVWALGVIVILALGALGLSTILGAAGNIIGQTGVPDVNAPSVDPAAAATTLRNSALGAFISLAIPALAATLGGAVGVASEVDDRTAA
jgi:hypothetical protein